jgi:predicted nucleic acid-binding protein
MNDVFVDTNVILYSFDDSVPSKRDYARKWLAVCWQRRCGRLSTQVTNEFYANARKRFARAITPAQAQAEVRRYQQWKPWTIDMATVETAWAVEGRYGLSYWDALMVAAAQHLGCAWLLTEDLQHNQLLDGVRVLNPFLTGPDILDATP